MKAAASLSHGIIGTPIYWHPQSKYPRMVGIDETGVQNVQGLSVTPEGTRTGQTV